MFRSRDEIVELLADKAGVLVGIALMCALALFAVWWRDRKDEKRHRR